MLKKIFAHPDNQKVLKHLKLTLESIKYFKSGYEAGSSFDEGSQVLFYKYGAGIPTETNYTLGIYNLMVNPGTGQIFAFHWGRFTFLIRCDFEKSDYQNSDSLRCGTTLDAWVDFRDLGENWALLDAFIDEEKEHLKAAYELSLTAG